MHCLWDAVCKDEELEREIRERREKNTSLFVVVLKGRVHVEGRR